MGQKDQLRTQREAGLRRIERELDVAYFIRKQMIFAGLIKALTTKLQRQLARRRYSLIVGEPDEDSSTESSGSDFDFPATLPGDKVTKTLQSDLYKTKFGLRERPPDDDTKIEVELMD